MEKESWESSRCEKLDGQGSITQAEQKPRPLPSNAEGGAIAPGTIPSAERGEKPSA